MRPVLRHPDLDHAGAMRRLSRDETESLAVLAIRSLLLEAGYPTFKRGLEYADGGHVSGLRFSKGVLRARVKGTRRYRVQVAFGAEPSFWCNCPVGEEGAVCKHCVAATLAWIGT
jgi:uncharacterized Zn finger protein